jgi:hypothetical protein
MRTGCAFSGGSATEPLATLAAEVLTTGVVPRSGVTAAGEVPTVESGCVPGLAAGAFVVAPSDALCLVSKGALEPGVGVGDGSALCDFA